MAIIAGHSPERYASYLHFSSFGIIIIILSLLKNFMNEREPFFFRQFRRRVLGSRRQRRFLMSIRHGRLLPSD